MEIKSTKNDKGEFKYTRQKNFKSFIVKDVKVIRSQR